MATSTWVRAKLISKAFDWSIQASSGMRVGARIAVQRLSLTKPDGVFKAVPVLILTVCYNTIIKFVGVIRGNREMLGQCPAHGFDCLADGCGRLFVANSLGDNGFANLLPSFLCNIGVTFAAAYQFNVPQAPQQVSMEALDEYHATAAPQEGSEALVKPIQLFEKGVYCFQGQKIEVDDDSFENTGIEEEDRSLKYYGQSDQV